MSATSSANLYNGRSMVGLPPALFGGCRYFLQAIRCAMHDYNVRAKFFSVNHMMVPPTAMFHPSIASKVALMSIKDAWGALTSA